ncbi:HrpE/YscL family type III secretion apparatus protein [Trinickia dinghuensis]|nr:HrpE/YscL family type III secretion apparatus protein [Trinickia dinghuensis]
MSFTARRISTGDGQDAMPGKVVYLREDAARLRDADAAFVTRAAALEEAYRLAQRSLTAQLEVTLDQVLAAALARVGAELPAAQRLRIVCEQLAETIGPVSGARLRIGTAGESSCSAAGIRCPWPIDVDDALAPGSCRLVTECGEWGLEFDALIASLQTRGFII